MLSIRKYKKKLSNKLLSQRSVIIFDASSNPADQVSPHGPEAELDEGVTVAQASPIASAI